MDERHWIIAYNEFTDECRFMQLLKEWLPFKYTYSEDDNPNWKQIGLYETQHDAFSAFLNLSEGDSKKLPFLEYNKN